MRRAYPVLIGLLVAACAAVPSSGDGWLPPTQPPPPPPPPPVVEQPDVADEEPPADTGEADAYSAALRAALRDAPSEPDREPAVLDTAEGYDRPVVRAVAPGSFGPRLVGILHGTQPPRAVIGLADGRELVVQPGTMLPDDGLIVLAVGTAGVQVATVTPEGDRAAIRTLDLRPLYGAPRDLAVPAVTPVFSDPSAR